MHLHCIKDALFVRLSVGLQSQGPDQGILRTLTAKSLDKHGKTPKSHKVAEAQSRQRRLSAPQLCTVGVKF
jgi:hypothetical protein